MTKRATPKDPFQIAVLAARERTGREEIGLTIDKGLFQVVSVVHEKPNRRGKSKVTPLSGWLRGADVIDFLNAL